MKYSALLATAAALKMPDFGKKVSLAQKKPGLSFAQIAEAAG